MKNAPPIWGAFSSPATLTPDPCGKAKATAGGPFKPDFGLSGGVHELRRSFDSAESFSSE